MGRIDLTQRAFNERGPQSGILKKAQGVAAW